MMSLRWRILFSLSSRRLCRTVYSGPDGLPDFTREYEKNTDTSWEARKLKNIRQRVIDKEKGKKFEDLEKIVDDEARRIAPLSHFIFSDDPAVCNKDLMLGQRMEILGNPSSDGKNNIKEKYSKSSNLDPDFIRPEVQEILKRIRGKDPKIIFKRKLERNKEMPKIQLLSDEQLKQKYEEALEAAEKFLEMPPVMTEREPIDEELAFDEKLDGYEHSSLVFTDISEDLNRNERFIVVRETNGKLRKATWEERDRMLQIYFPKPQRDILKPELFDDLTVALKNEFHENVLQQILIHFDPDSANYINLTKQVYDDIDEKGAFELLRSTRFFGGLAFYLTKHKSIDNLLIYFLHSKLLEEASDLINLYYLIKPKSEVSQQIQDIDDAVEKVKIFVANEAINARAIKLALNPFLKSHQKRTGKQRSVQ
ncbi:small ribosomal subunit protein mS22-like [Clavelina lepadiformis]|uniref:small ribosomal subunit protein mS22-like n=1 Tax=Clavelina lepadiformis TaxID=159417 RepID=UPI004040F132